MYYSKLSNAFNNYREIPVPEKFPNSSENFAKRDPEWQIVGAFATDPVEISNIISGNGTTANNLITVTTSTPHNLNIDTPIKIKGVGEPNYNVSTKVQNGIDAVTFTYLLESFPINLDANPSSSGANVTVETDTVTGASPYIFNTSLRSVWGMNGMHADGLKASGFRSMVEDQFTAVSLQKDDRAFVKYNPQSRAYEGVDYDTVYGAELATQASQTDTTKIYHLDQEAVYRQGWETSHIKISNDSFIQVVSVFAIGFNKHFDIERAVTHQSPTLTLTSVKYHLTLKDIRPRHLIKMIRHILHRSLVLERSILKMRKRSNGLLLMCRKLLRQQIQKNYIYLD